MIHLKKPVTLSVVAAFTIVMALCGMTGAAALGTVGFLAYLLFGDE